LERRVPRAAHRDEIDRLVVVLDGEGPANDATALILYRFAIAAASTGLFSFGQALGIFALIVVGEIG
jgi:CPA1 family monovalent cation:H+ antiporter